MKTAIAVHVDAQLCLGLMGLLCVTSATESPGQRLLGVLGEADAGGPQTSSINAAASSFAAPPGSAWHAMLRAPHLRALQRDTPTTAPAPQACPNATWAAAVEEAGLLSVKLFGAVGDGKSDDSVAVEAAMNASDTCGGCVFFPPTALSYCFGHTVALRGCIKGGGGGGGAQGQGRPSVSISGGSMDSPTVSISGTNVYVQDITFNGATLAVYIANAAVVRFVNVGAQIEAMGNGVDHVDARYDTTDTFPFLIHFLILKG
eukprot:COSAG03_NODE_1223_length_4527_cov_1.524164_2_plen_260_part_00